MCEDKVSSQRNGKILTVNVSVCLSACVHEAAIQSWNGFIKFHIAVTNRHFYSNFVQKFDNNNRHFERSSACDFLNLKINLCVTR